MIEQPDHAAHAEKQSALAQLGQIALSNASLDFIFMHATTMVCRVLAVDMTGILMRREKALLLVAGHGFPEGSVGSALSELGPGSQAGYTIARREPVVVTDLSSESRFVPSRYLVDLGIHSGVTVTIDAGEDEPWGVMGALSRTPNALTTGEIDFMRAVAATIGQAIERRRVEVELRLRAVQQSAIGEFAQRLLTTEIDQAALERLCELVMDGMGVEFSLFLEADEHAESLSYRAGHRWMDESVPSFRFDDSHAGIALRTGQPVIVTDYEADGRFPYFRSFGIRSGVTIPVLAPAGRFGVLTAQTRALKRFYPGDVQFMQSLAAVLAHGLARDRADRELVESEQRFRSVVEGASEIIFSVTPNGEIATLNPAFEAITGWRTEEWIGRSFEELIVPEQRPEMLALFYSMMTEPRSVRTEARMRAKSGGEILVAAAVSPKIVRGELVEIYGFARDVTDERRLQSERNRAARELQLVLESTDEGIFATDMSGSCTIINRSAARMLAASRDFLLGSAIHGLIHPGEHDCDIAEINGKARGGGALREDVFFRADGTSFPVEYSVSPIVDAGQVKGSVVAFNDITARKQLEAQLEQANRLTSLGHLAATVAHEFNNVLMGIAPFAEVLTREEMSERGKTAVEQISRSVLRGKRITQDILRFTQPAEPVLAAFDANKWIHTVAYEAGSLIGAKYAVTVDVPAQPVRIVADAGQLHQSLINLIVNARDAMPAGGTIALRITPPADGNAHFIVEDHGQGIRPEIVRHIFEPLFTTKKNGTGLGLPVTRHVVKRHGGEIFVESEVGKGTKFHIFIPLAKEEAEAVPASGAPPGPHERKYRRVLLVEDERSVAAGIASLLELEGVSVTVIENGRDVPRAIEDVHPDAVVLDIGLPDMDGTKVFDAIARAHPGLPVVFSSGHADESKLENYLAEPHVGFLLKPYDLDALLSTLDRVVS